MQFRDLLRYECRISTVPLNPGDTYVELINLRTTVKHTQLFNTHNAHIFIQMSTRLIHNLAVIHKCLNLLNQ